jgi:hypothetical protein
MGDIGTKYPTELFLGEHNYMIQALSTNGADELCS